MATAWIEGEVGEVGRGLVPGQALWIFLYQQYEALGELQAGGDGSGCHVENDVQGTRTEAGAQPEGCCISSGKMPVILTWVLAVEVLRSGQTGNLFKGKDESIY